jgi:hypothetical protein
MRLSLGQNPTFSCQQLVMKLIVMDDQLWMKNHLVSNNNNNIVYLESLKKNLQGMTNNVGLTLSVGDTIAR